MPTEMVRGHGLRNYLLITIAYWAFTLTDGALRMLVVLYFHQLGYTPLAIASLFLFYELFGIVTNLFGGWLGARLGLNLTLHTGLGLQICALLMLTVDPSLLSLAYVMAAQALSGIAKDLNKMSAKAGVKLMAPEEDGALFRWVAVLTGSKNALKGLGFFLGGLLLALFGFQGALFVLAGMLSLVLLVTLPLLPRGLGISRKKAQFTQLLSRSPAINRLSAARLFLFGSRDAWFVVALPVFLAAEQGWGHASVGSLLALWVIGYGIVQALAPRLVRDSATHTPMGARNGALTLALSCSGIALMLGIETPYTTSLLIAGLALFGLIFALNSALHSYLILAYSDHDGVAINVGFYYMANATGRLCGTLLSGWGYQSYGLEGCLWIASAMLISAAFISRGLPPPQQV